MPNTTIDKDKARRAASHPNRSGELCRAEVGAWHPVVDRNRCEAKHDCVDVCPEDVLEVRSIDANDFKGLSLLGKVKSIAHGRRSAYTPRADRCLACGLCVVACPEDALTLVRTVR
jgi:NAD-dependent dihydropyrimidine dehydrogenase PreA subunit